MASFKGLRVYYQLSDGTIESGIVVATRMRGKFVEFKGGGWNPTKSCFLTRSQLTGARTHLKKAGRRLMDAVSVARRCSDQCTEMLASIDKELRES